MHMGRYYWCMVRLRPGKVAKCSPSDENGERIGRFLNRISFRNIDLKNEPEMHCNKMKCKKMQKYRQVKLGDNKNA